MSEYYSAIYHRGLPSHCPPGQLVLVEDHDGAWADIFLHHDHVRPEVVWDFNWLTRHQIGNGLWQQRWTHPGRMQEPIEGHNIAQSTWELYPAHKLPRDRFVLPVEHQGSCAWLIRKHFCTTALRDEMNNRVLKRIAGDALWIQYWYRYQASAPRLPLRLPPAAPALV
ncbi:hypothetical protein ABTX35_01325 [Streptomyces sp. NPDC096080]|uniref:hypothetical protein n=1 Tax=Streptomyces sp. NPDC096080 TaxID=3156693 RepID=UPI003326AE54